MAKNYQWHRDFNSGTEVDNEEVFMQCLIKEKNMRNLT